jgi:hypothetical protein
MARGILRKVAKKYSMHASKSSPVLIVKGDGFGNFYVPRINMEWIKRIWYHMLQLLEAKYVMELSVSASC